MVPSVMRLCVFSNGGKSRPTDTLSAAHASRNWLAGRFRLTKMQLVWQSGASYPRLLNASSVNSRTRAFSARSSSMCFGSLSDATPAAADPGTGNRLQCLGLANGVAQTQASHPVRLRERSGDEDAG